jgi:hypothetical protein
MPYFMSIIPQSFKLSKPNQLTSCPNHKPLHSPPNYNPFIHVSKYNSPRWRKQRRRRRRRRRRRNRNRHDSPTFKWWNERSPSFSIRWNT